MLLAIDVGNTHTVFGLWNPDAEQWLSIWRRATNPEETEDQLAVWLKGVQSLAGVETEVHAVIIGSVVPQMDAQLERLADKWLGVAPLFLRTGADVGLEIDYSPPQAVGADRIANALGALGRFKPPIIVVDFGTATTFDTIDERGVYVGGAILPGVTVSTRALARHTAKLPQIELVAPPRAIGKNTVESLQSGVMLGYAGAVDALARRIDQELGGNSTILSTGGLGSIFQGLSEVISEHVETLTLDGLARAYTLMQP